MHSVQPARAILFAITTATILTACQPNALTDAQVVLVSKRCEALGMATRIFNGATSIVECVPVERNP